MLTLPKPEPEPSGLRGKGGLDLRVHRASTDGSTALLSGAVVAPSTTLGFEARAAQDGHAMVVGVEATGTLYDAWPTGGEQRAAPLRASDRLMPLAGALVVDASVGREWLHLVWCPQPFDLGDVARGEADGLTLAAGCASVEFALVKAAP